VDEDALYVLPPEDFTAARDAAARAAKAAGDADRAKELKALRRPNASAWLVNLLATHESDLLEQLIALGPALAQAQAQGRGNELRELGAQRRELVEAVTERAVALGERPVTSSVRAEVSATLDTALADPEAADAVRSGRLVRPLSYAGFGGVDLDGAVAVSRPQPAKAPERDRDAVADAEAAALEAAGQLDDAVRECEVRAAEREAAEQQQAEAERSVERARRALAEAEAAAEQARSTTDAAAEAVAAATLAVRAAQSAAEQARGELDRLRRGD
jgi:hypothetical protein